MEARPSWCGLLEALERCESHAELLYGAVGLFGAGGCEPVVAGVVSPEERGARRVASPVPDARTDEILTCSPPVLTG